MAGSENLPNGWLHSCLTVDVEDWYHILDSPATPTLTSWPLLESRIERNFEALLELLDAHCVKATFFWLGWLARRHPALVHMCHKAGHEIASHGYAHVLAYEAGPQAFRQDIVRAKTLLEDMIAEPVRGFRAPGFGIDQALLDLRETSADTSASLTLPPAVKQRFETVDEACATALDMGVPDYRFVRRYLERNPQLPLSLRQIDPLIRELVQYRELIEQRTKEIAE